VLPLSLLPQQQNTKHETQNFSKALTETKANRQTDKQTERHRDSQRHWL